MANTERREVAEHAQRLVTGTAGRACSLISAHAMPGCWAGRQQRTAGAAAAEACAGRLRC